MTAPALPGWPRGLKAELAAAYLGMSEGLFLREVEAGNLPKPVWITTGRKVWLREVLDAWLDSRAGKAPDKGRSNGEWLGQFDNDDGGRGRH